MEVPLGTNTNDHHGQLAVVITAVLLLGGKTNDHHARLISGAYLAVSAVLLAVAYSTNSNMYVAAIIVAGGAIVTTAVRSYLRFRSLSTSNCHTPS
jgi:hypothetical protein